MDKSVVGKRIRHKRESLSLSREEFAEKIGISSQFLAQIENATRGMSADTLYKICVTFGISADYILLGQQPTDGMRVPAVDLLTQIPPKYVGLLEESLNTLLSLIALAEDRNM